MELERKMPIILLDLSETRQSAVVDRALKLLAVRATWCIRISSRATIDGPRVQTNTTVLELNINQCALGFRQAQLLAAVIKVPAQRCIASQRRLSVIGRPTRRCRVLAHSQTTSESPVDN